MPSGIDANKHTPEEEEETKKKSPLSDQQAAAFTGLSRFLVGQFSSLLTRFKVAPMPDLFSATFRIYGLKTGLGRPLVNLSLLVYFLVVILLIYSTIDVRDVSMKHEDLLMKYIYTKVSIYLSIYLYIKSINIM